MKMARKRLLAAILFIAAPLSPAAAYQVTPPFAWAFSSNKQYAIIFDIRHEAKDCYRYSIHATGGNTTAREIVRNPILWTIDGGWTHRLLAVPAVSDDGTVAAVIAPDSSRVKTYRLELWCSTGMYAATSMDMHDKTNMGPSESEWYRVSISGRTATVSYAIHSRTAKKLPGVVSTIERFRDFREVDFSLSDASRTRSAALPDRIDHTWVVWNRYTMTLTGFVCAVGGVILSVLVLILIMRARPGRGGV